MNAALHPAILWNRLLQRLNTWADRLDRAEDAFVLRHGILLPSLLLLAWTALLLILGYALHIPWRDETQSWLMARDMTVPELFRNAGLEGHPIGWHLVIKPLTLLGLPFESLRLLNCLLVFAAAAVLVFRGPFRFWHKAFILSSPIFIVYGLYARCYSLILLLLFLHAQSHARRMEHPFYYAFWLGCLANTIVLCLPYAACMGAYWAWEAARGGKLRSLPVAAGLLLLLAMGFAAFIQILPPPEKARFLLGVTISRSLRPLYTTNPYNIFAFLLVPAFLFWRMLKTISRSVPALTVIFLTQVVFFICLHTFIYELRYRHLLLLFAFMIVITWIMVTECFGEKVFSAASLSLRRQIAAFCMLFCIDSADGLIQEHVQLNSNIPTAIPYVRKFLRDEPIAAHIINEVSPLAAYIPGLRFWNPVGSRWDTFAYFDMNWLERGSISPDHAAALIMRNCPVTRPVIIFSYRWRKPAEYGYVLTFVANEATRWKESIFVYMPKEKIKPGMTALPPDFALRRAERHE